MYYNVKMNVLYLDSCASTNDELYTLALDSRNTVDAVVAKTQTAGKGTKGRSFESPPSTGIYMSVLLRDIDAEHILDITPIAGVIVRQALIDIVSVYTKIKPVNDLYLNGKKVCGILCQANSTGSKVNFVIAGIGINLFAPEGGFSGEISDIAGSILTSYDERIKTGLIERITADLLALPAQIKSDGYRAKMMKAYEENQVNSQDNISVRKYENQ